MLKQMHHRVAALAAAILLTLWGVSAQGQEQIFPPWSHGKNAPAIDKGKEHPDLKDRIYYETLPPGILIKQMAARGTITVGNMTWTIHPDVYAADLETVDMLIHKGTLAGPAVPYVTNDLTIMIPRDNHGDLRCSHGEGCSPSADCQTMA